MRKSRDLVPVASPSEFDHKARCIGNANRCEILIAKRTRITKKRFERCDTAKRSQKRPEAPILSPADVSDRISRGAEPSSRSRLTEFESAALSMILPLIH